MVNENRQFILDTLWHSQRVQVAKKWHDDVKPTCSQDNMCKHG